MVSSLLRYSSTAKAVVIVAGLGVSFALLVFVVPLGLFTLWSKLSGHGDSVPCITSEAVAELGRVETELGEVEEHAARLLRRKRELLEQIAAESKAVKP